LPPQCQRRGLSRAQQLTFYATPVTLRLTPMKKSLVLLMVLGSFLATLLSPFNLSSAVKDCCKSHQCFTTASCCQSSHPEEKTTLPSLPSELQTIKVKHLSLLCDSKVGNLLADTTPLNEGPVIFLYSPGSAPPLFMTKVSFLI